MTTNNAINLSTSGVCTYDGAGTFTGSTLTQHAVLIGGAASAIVSVALTDGQLAIGSTGAQPVAATLSAGAGVGITNAAGSITIAATGGGLAWSTIAGTSQAAAINNGYVIGNAGLTTVTLPATAALGSVVVVAGSSVGVGGWKVAQNANQYIILGKLTSSVGVGGYVASTDKSDCITLTCIVANNGWECVTPPQGNITVA